MGLSARNSWILSVFVAAVTIYFISMRFETFFMQNRSLSFEARVRKLENITAGIVKKLKTLKDQ